MLKMVDGTGIIGVDMVCPLGVSTPQPPNYDRVELEGTGMLVLPNSLDAPLDRLELGGKTEQVSTRGVNLWSKESKITFTATKQVVFDTPIPAGDYVVSANVTSNDKDGTVCLMLFYYTDSGSKGANLTRAGRASAKITFTSDVKHVVLYAGQNANGSANDTATFADIQLEKGSTATAYEPYTGGKPSPSQEYQQKIKNSGKWNEEKQKYEVDVKVTGKNLFDKDSVKKGYEFSSVASDMESPREGWFVSDFISVAEGKVYISGKSTGGGCKLYNKDKLFVKNIQATSGQLTIEEGISYFRLNGETKDLNNIQVELGSVSTTYEPYRKLQTLTLALDQPLRGIGEMKDELSESGILRRVKNIALNGSEKWYKYENNAFVAMNCYGLKIDDLEVRNYSLTTLCNFFKWARFPQDIESQTAHGGYIYFTVPKETYPDLESFKGWLAKNTPVLEYWLKEPALEELSEEDKASIRALKTYYPTTVITADGGELDPDIKVTYRKEI